MGIPGHESTLGWSLVMETKKRRGAMQNSKLTIRILSDQQEIAICKNGSRTTHHDALPCLFYPCFDCHAGLCHASETIFMVADCGVDLRAAATGMHWAASLRLLSVGNLFRRDTRRYCIYVVLGYTTSWQEGTISRNQTGDRISCSTQ
jgi:hypothetical protein